MDLRPSRDLPEREEDHQGKQNRENEHDALRGSPTFRDRKIAGFAAGGSKNPLMCLVRLLEWRDQDVVPSAIRSGPDVVNMLHYAPVRGATF